MIKPLKPEGPERRFLAPGLRVETRDAPEESPGRTIVGHAAVFDQWATIYEGDYYLMREVVRPGAFANALREKQDVRALFNHDSNFVLGRTASGTLRLSEDGIGLLSETVPPDTQAARDLLLSIARGDVNQMSFAFAVRAAGPEVQATDAAGRTVIEDGGQRITIYRQGDQLVEERELLDLDLFDVSPVTVPAYPQTDVGLRSLVERHAREVRNALVGTPRRNRMERRLRLSLAD